MAVSTPLAALFQLTVVYLMVAVASHSTLSSPSQANAPVDDPSTHPTSLPCIHHRIYVSCVVKQKGSSGEKPAINGLTLAQVARSAAKTRSAASVTPLGQKEHTPRAGVVASKDCTLISMLIGRLMGRLMGSLIDMLMGMIISMNWSLLLSCLVQDQIRGESVMFRLWLTHFCGLPGVRL